MSHMNDLYDELFSENIELPLKQRNRKQSAEKRRLKARRKVEDIRDKRRLKRQIDPYSADY